MLHIIHFRLRPNRLLRMDELSNWPLYYLTKPSSRSSRPEVTRSERHISGSIPSSDNQRCSCAPCILEQQSRSPSEQAGMDDRMLMEVPFSLFEDRLDKARYNVLLRKEKPNAFHRGTKLSLFVYHRPSMVHHDGNILQ